MEILSFLLSAVGRNGEILGTVCIQLRDGFVRILLVKSMEPRFSLTEMLVVFFVIRFLQFKTRIEQHIVIRLLLYNATIFEWLCCPFCLQFY